MNGPDDRNPYRRRLRAAAPADATRTRQREPARYPEIRAAPEPSPVDEFTRALVTTAAEYLNLGEKPIPSPRHKRELMRARMDAGTLKAEPEDFEPSSGAARVGELLGHVLPSMLLNRGTPLSGAVFRGGASVGEAASAATLAPYLAGLIATEPTPDPFGRRLWQPPAEAPADALRYAAVGPAPPPRRTPSSVRTRRESR